MENFTDALIEEVVSTIDTKENTYELKNNWIELHFTPEYLNYLANKAWVSNDSTEKSFYRTTLSLEERNANLKILQTLLPNVKYDTNCELLRTSTRFDKDSYYILFKFYTLSNEEKIIDAWVSETDAFNNIRAVRQIDPRSPSCLDVYNSIISDGKVDVATANYIVQCGSTIWSRSPEAKVQFKLNSSTSEHIFEEVLDELQIQYKIVDPYDSKFYKGSPGNRSDFIITIDGVSYKIEIKLLWNNNTLSTQDAHDADIMIGSEVLSKNVAYMVTNDSKKGEELEQLDIFKQILEVYNAKLKAAGNCYLKIKSINLKTGEIDYEFYKSPLTTNLITQQNKYKK